MPATSAPDRPKITTACYNCRQRKLRCDGSKPSCSNCLLYIAECSYAQGRNKSGPPRGSKRQSTVDARTGLPQNTIKRSKRSSLQSASNASPTPNSPVASADVIPSLIGPLSSEWLTEWDASGSNQTVESSRTNGINDLDTPWSFPGIEDDHTVMETDSFVIPDFISPSTPPFITQNDILRSTNCLTETNANHAVYQISNSLGSQSIPSPQATPPLLNQIPTYNAQSAHCLFDLQQNSQSPELHALRLIHAFAPIFHFHELAEIISDCESRKVHSIHAAFFLSAFHSLSVVASTSQSSIPNLRESRWYLAAQQQAMQAYFALISLESPVGRDACYTAAGLVYLAIHAVFTHGWGKETSTWLRFAVDVIEYLPVTSAMNLGLRCWFARIVWLWDKALTCCESELPSAFINASGSISEIIRDSSSLTVSKFDEEQRTFFGFIELCMDLEHLISTNTVSRSSALHHSLAEEAFGAFAGLPASAVPPLCQRVQTWVKSCSVAQDFFLHFDTDFKSDDGGRDSFGRVLHIIYYSMVIKLNNVDRVQCGLKKTSLIVALARLIDAADWIVRTRRLYLWPFADRALHFAKDYLIYQSEVGQTVLPATQNTYWALASPPNDTDSPTETPSQPLKRDACMMLSLIKDVFMEAHSALDPIMASAQRTSAGRAVESISIALYCREGLKSGLLVDSSSSEALLAGFKQFIAGISPHLLSLQISETIQ